MEKHNDDLRNDIMAKVHKPFAPSESSGLTSKDIANKSAEYVHAFRKKAGEAFDYAGEKANAAMNDARDYVSKTISKSDNPIARTARDVLHNTGLRVKSTGEHVHDFVHDHGGHMAAGAAGLAGLIGAGVAAKKYMKSRKTK
jgi:ElaB/YqjD/DUF883 family membrane-anchored ribosome-binding protein